MGNEIEKNIVLMTSREIADFCGKKHSHILRDIDKMLLTINNSNVDPDPKMDLGITVSKYIDINNQSRREYRLTEYGVLFVVSKYDDNVRFKVIKHLKSLQGIIEKRTIDKDWDKLRNESKSTLESMKITIEEIRAESGKVTESGHYIYYNKLVNELVLGSTAKEFCNKHNISQSTYRNKLPSNMLEAIKLLHKQVENLLTEYGQGFNKEIEERLKSFYNNRLIKKLGLSNYSNIKILNNTDIKEIKIA